jgi:hypothetical protein
MKQMAGVAGLEPATPGFGVRFLPLLLVCSRPVVTDSVGFSRMFGVADTLLSRPIFRSSVAKMVAVRNKNPACKQPRHYPVTWLARSPFSSGRSVNEK